MNAYNYLYVNDVRQIQQFREQNNNMTVPCRCYFWMPVTDVKCKPLQQQALISTQQFKKKDGNIE